MRSCVSTTMARSMGVVFPLGAFHWFSIQRVESRAMVWRVGGKKRFASFHSMASSCAVIFATESMYSSLVFSAIFLFVVLHGLKDVLPAVGGIEEDLTKGLVLGVGCGVEMLEDEEEHGHGLFGVVGSVDLVGNFPAAAGLCNPFVKFCLIACDGNGGFEGF